MSIIAAHTTQESTGTEQADPAIALFIQNVGCNKSVANTLYTNAEAGANQLQVMLYATGHDATITGCTKFDVTTQETTPANGSLLSLDLTPLQLTNDQFKLLEVKLNTNLTAPPFNKSELEIKNKNNPSWIVKKDPSSHIIYFAPKCSGTLTQQTASQTTPPPQQTALVFNLTNFATPQLPGAHTILPTGTAYNISPMAGEGGHAFPNCPLTLAAAPNATDLSLPTALSLSLQSNGFLVPTTYTPFGKKKPSHEPGSFSFTLKSQGQGAKPDSNTAFYLSFPINDPNDPKTKKYALTTKQAAENIQVTAPAGWGVTPNTVAEPYWILTPPANQTIAKHGATFTVCNIETDFPPHVTFMTLSWNDPHTHQSTLAGYNAGTFYGTIDLVARPKIKSFKFSPDPIWPTIGKSSVTVSGTLSWEIENFYHNGTVTGLAITNSTVQQAVGHRTVTDGEIPKLEPTVLKKWFHSHPFSLTVFGPMGSIVTASATPTIGVPIVPRTGQTKCYDESGQVISCANTGQDGDHKAGVIWPTPRFKDNGNGTVTDCLTGLIWLKNANCAEKQTDFSTALTWVKELNKKGTMNGNNAGDTSKGGTHQTDWRLPNVKELQSLIDYGQSNPALPQGHPFANVLSLDYWGSTTDWDGTLNGWDVNLGSGSMYYYGRTSDYYVWPVRGGQ